MAKKPPPRLRGGGAPPRQPLVAAPVPTTATPRPAPAPPTPGGLGLGLGLKKKGQQAFQAAATAGTGQDWLAAHKRIAARAAAKAPGSVQAGRIAAFTSGPGAGQTPWRPGAPGGAQPPPGAPPVTPPPGPPTPDTAPPGPPGAPPGPRPSLGDIAEKYKINMPEELNVAGAGAIKAWNEAQDWQNSAYEEQFNRLQQQSQEQSNKDVASLKEAYGSMGARYGSDIATAQSDAQRKATLALETQGYDVRKGLNEQRLAQMSGAMGAMTNIGASKANIATSAMEKAWQDYAMSMAPPEMWDEMMGYATSFSPPGTVVY